MNKRDYHLTPEQALEIASNLELDGCDITVWENGYVEFENKEALQSFVNAVLDQVLGEPVAWAERGRENNVIADLVKQTNKNDWVKPYTVALYAPKEKL